VVFGDLNCIGTKKYRLILTDMLKSEQRIWWSQKDVCSNQLFLVGKRKGIIQCFLLVPSLDKAILEHHTDAGS
jgi:hypothetical protein